MKPLDVLTFVLVIVGAVNWGLVGLTGIDLVATVFGLSFGEVSAPSAIVYGLVGLAGLYQAATWRRVPARLSVPSTQPTR